MSDEPPCLPNKCKIYKQTDLIASRYVTLFITLMQHMTMVKLYKDDTKMQAKYIHITLTHRNMRQWPLTFKPYED
jgi:hypothetical protein